MPYYENGTQVIDEDGKIAFQSIVGAPVDLKDIIANTFTTQGKTVTIRDEAVSYSSTTWAAGKPMIFKGASGSKVNLRAFATNALQITNDFYNGGFNYYKTTGHGRVLVNGVEVAYVSRNTGSADDSTSCSYSAWVLTTLNYGDVITFESKTGNSSYNDAGSGGGQVASNDANDALLFGVV